MYRKTAQNADSVKILKFPLLVGFYGMIRGQSHRRLLGSRGRDRWVKGEPFIDLSTGGRRVNQKRGV